MVRPRRFRLPAILFTTALILTACGARVATGPAPARAPVQQPGPVQPVPAPAPAPPTPPAPSVPVSPDLLDRLEAGSWRLDAVAALLPPAEGQYQAKREDPNYIEYAYAGGALRLYGSPKGGQIFALLVDVSNPDYAAFAKVQTTDHYAVVSAAPYVVICRAAPLDQETFLTLNSRSLPLADVRSRLGEPSYTAHVHGVGSDLFTYIPQGLTFVTDGANSVRLMDPKRPPWNDPTQPPIGLTYEAYRHDFADALTAFGKNLASNLALTQAALAKGKPSPDGRYLATKIGGNGFWGDWIYIQRPKQAEVRVNADYFIQDLQWLDDHRLVYITAMTFGDTYPFYAIDAVTGQQTVIVQIPSPKGHQISTFGVAGPGRLWYQTDDGVRHEVAVSATAQ